MGSTGPRARIDFKKYGHDGVWIKCRVNNGDWSSLAVNTVKPYLDERPSPLASHTKPANIECADRIKAKPTANEARRGKLGRGNKAAGPAG